MSGHISIGVIPKCYAVLWSYGEICVHSNCCGRWDKDRKAIIKARIEYHKKCLEERKRFDKWMDDPKWRKTQERNIKADIAYNKKMLARLRAGSLART